MAQAIKGRHYRHKKGGRYVVLDFGQDSETRGDVVIYRSLDHGTVWVRPRGEFEDEGRFELVDAPPGSVTRDQAVQILSQVTDQDNWWEMACERVLDLGEDEEVPYPSIYDVFEALGVPRAEFSRLTGES
jgi:hypothetical protein